MDIIPFQSPDFSIRVVDIDGEPWFVGKDVAEMLGYKDTVNAIKQHCKMGAAKHHPILDRMGRAQQVRLINESDLGGFSGQKVNLLLAGAGLQAKVGNHWQPLDAGQDFSCILDTGKQHGSGAPVQQIKWSHTVLPLLRVEDVAESVA